MSGLGVVQRLFQSKKKVIHTVPTGTVQFNVVCRMYSTNLIPNIITVSCSMVTATKLAQIIRAMLKNA